MIAITDYATTTTKFKIIEYYLQFLKDFSDVTCKRIVRRHRNQTYIENSTRGQMQRCNSIPQRSILCF